MIRGHNADPLYEHSNDHQLEFFSKAGTLIRKGKRGRSSFYGSETTAEALFQPMWMQPGMAEKETALRLLFWLRDPRGGAGNRSGFRAALRWMVAQPAIADDISGAAWLAVNMTRIPEWGRWDDLAELFGTPLEKLAAAVWAEAIMRQDHLACKWAKCDMVPLQRALRINEHGLRKLIVPPRASIVERAMCSGEWQGIEYSKIPSKAMGMYTKAFKVHDQARFEAYKAALVRGDKDVKINASVLFPHDCAKQAQRGDVQIAEAQFRALPDYVSADGKKRHIMVLADTSGSMEATAIDNVSRRDVAISLACYCSDRLGQDNQFYRQYMEFETEPFFVDWRQQTFVQAIKQHRGYVGSTDIQAALNTLLTSAKMWKIPREQMINMLLIISDMQFDQHTGGSVFNCGCCGTERTVVEKCMEQWEAAGYERPVIVYWNLAGYAGQPAQVQTPNTALVSGFSPAILQSILSGKDVSPREVMLRAIAKYQVEVPLVGNQP